MKNIIILIITAIAVNLQAQVKSGVYYELRNYNSKMAISNNGSKANAAPLYQIQDVGEDGRWTFIKNGDYYQIRNQNSGQYIANFKQKSHGAAMKQTNGPGDGALWKMTRLPNGYYQFQNKLSGLYLANRLSKKEGAPICQVNNPGEGSHWVLQEVKRAPGLQTTPPPPPTSWKRPEPDPEIGGSGRPTLKINYLKKAVDVSGRMATTVGSGPASGAVPSSFAIELGEDIELEWSVSFENIDNLHIYFEGREVAGEQHRASDGAYWMNGKRRVRPTRTASYTLRAVGLSVADPRSEAVSVEKTIEIKIKSPVFTVLTPQVDQDDLSVRFLVRNTGEADFRTTPIRVTYLIDGGRLGRSSFTTTAMAIPAGRQVELGRISLPDRAAAFRNDQISIRVTVGADYLAPLAESSREFTHRWAVKTFSVNNTLLEGLSSLTNLQIRIDNYVQGHGRGYAIPPPYDRNASYISFNVLGSGDERTFDTPPDESQTVGGHCYMRYQTFINNIYAESRGNPELFSVEDGKLRLSIPFPGDVSEEIKIGRRASPCDLVTDQGNWIDGDAPNLDLSGFTANILLTPVIRSGRVGYGDLEVQVRGLEARFTGALAGLNPGFKDYVTQFVRERVELELRRTMNSSLARDAVERGIRQAIDLSGAEITRIISVSGSGDTITLRYL